MLPKRISKQLSIIMCKYLDPAEASKLMEELQDVSGLNGNIKNAFMDIKLKLDKELKKQKENLVNT